MARRGDVLRAHILDSAKALFLENGFERTSMDAVAARAETSKRSLYAHFPTKDVLFLAVIDRVDDLFQGRMRTPADYADDPAEAVTLFSARFLQMLAWAPILQTFRLAVTVADQFPEAARRIHAVFFESTTSTLSAYLTGIRDLDAPGAKAHATAILGASISPAFEEMLLGVRSTSAEVPDAKTLSSDVDLAAIRQVVEARLATVSAR